MKDKSAWVIWHTEMSFCFLLRHLRLLRFIYPVQLFRTYTLWLRVKRNNGNANDASDAMERSDLWQPGITPLIRVILFIHALLLPAMLCSGWYSGGGSS